MCGGGWTSSYHFSFPIQKKALLVKLCFFLHFTPLDPDSLTKMHPYPDPHRWNKEGLEILSIYYPALYIKK